jgi:hypothetical protein
LEDKDVWVHVLNMASLFAVRNPRLRESMRRFREQTGRIIADLVLATPERWESQKRRAIEAGYIDPRTSVTYEELKDFHRRGAYTIEVPTTSHIRAEFHVFEPVLRTMVRRKWTLLVAAPGSGGFLTSDHPICLMNSHGAATLSNSPGFGLTETTVLFPVTRDLVAIGTFEEGDKVLGVTPEQVALINGTVLHFADRQVYAASNKISVKLGLTEPTLRGEDIGRFIAARTAKKGK